ncbi:MAG: hypothetical protein J1F01_05675 [Oscillospiraceae bacterium]|nr:hypothetical protein [Oscillospiraceae bacterium]
MDKNQAVIDFLLNCEEFKNSQLYFNYVNAKDGAKGVITLATDKATQKPYIDGSVMKRYQFTIQDNRSISANPLVKIQGFNNENVTDFEDVQKLLDWITEQNEKKHYPDFGGDCQIDDMTATTENPRLDQIDATVTPPLARYSFTITINYLDTSEKMCN